MNALIIYNSNNVQSALARMVAKKYFSAEDYTITEKDSYGVTTGDMTTYITTTLSDDTYAKAMILSEYASSGATSKVSYDQVAKLRPKMATGYKGTTLVSGECANNVTATEVVLATADQEADDFYNGYFLEGTFGSDGSKVYRYISDYDNAANKVTVSTTTTALDDDNTDTYIIYSNANITTDYYGNSRGAAHAAFSYCYSSVTQIPFFIDAFSGSSIVDEELTADSVTASTLTDTGAFSDDVYAGKWLGIYSSTLGPKQKIKISSHTDDVLTLEDSFKVTPTGTIEYRVGDENKVLALEENSMIFWMYINGDFDALDRLIDMNHHLDNDRTTPSMDWSYYSDLIEKAKVVCLADTVGAV